MANLSTSIRLAPRVACPLYIWAPRPKRQAWVRLGFQRSPLSAARNVPNRNAELKGAEVDRKRLGMCHCLQVLRLVLDKSRDLSPYEFYKPESIPQHQ